MPKNLKGYTYKVANRMKGYGETDLDKKIIRINKARNKQSKERGELIDSIVHETLHAKHPKAKEKTIQKKTKKVVPRLSSKTKANLYGKFERRK